MIFDLQNISWNKFANQLTYDVNNPLLFNSGFFLYFLLIFLLGYIVVHQNPRARVIYFTLFSLYFFYKACGFYFAFLLIAAVVDFNLSNFIFKSTKSLNRKLLLAFSIIINLGLLFYFKYTNFFIEIINDISQSKIKPLSLILPIGISFYTFENLSYTIDVYRGKFKPINSFSDYLFFLSFFPKLVMGPIVRASDFIPQIRKKINLTKNDVAKGLYLILGGLFKKIVISDFIYLNFVQYIFDDPMRHTGLECLIGVYGYALVIYCDFSGYSDMAIGFAKWFGFDVNENFRLPYQSKNITEFWRRWHISLSSWLKDYLYIPLGGNKKGKIRQYLNLLITMLLGGLWHGASFTFIIWGTFHGLALGLDKLRIDFFQNTKFTLLNSKLKSIVGIFITFHFVCFCWIFFKSKNIDEAIFIINQITHNFNLSEITTIFNAYSNVLFVILLGITLHFIPIKYWNKLELYLQNINLLGKLLITIIFVWIILQVKQSEQVMPVYLQF
jgi:D-alanyl-lipoteichoic acid acyltransferase DltB (MBOAT superfamily)